MQNEITLNVLFGGISSVLLGIVAYFIKQLHTDFKSMERDISEVKTMALLIKTEYKTGYDLIVQRIDYLEQRVTKLEHFNQKHNQNEK